MAATKRTRFEVLRRDEFTCRYCRSTDNPLTVDHVVPVALGGSDDPSNLVAACRDCNAGKSSASPDADTVAAVAKDAERWAATLRLALARMSNDTLAAQDYRAEFYDTWTRWTNKDGDTVPLPDGWENTLEHWRKIGIPLAVLSEAVLIAMSKPQIRWTERFRYCCGVVWRKLDQVREQMAEAANVSESPDEESCGHCYGCRDTEDPLCVVYGERGPDEDPPTPCDVCGRTDCLFNAGLDEGRVEGWQQAVERLRTKVVAD